MANTEGMSDETVASLLTPGTPTTKTKSAFALRQERIQKRMNEPMGERPAATVIRPSPPSSRVQANGLDASGESKEQENSKLSAKEAAPPPPPPILKAVVERDVAPIHYSSSTSTIRKSHFASQQKSSDHTISGGFPSVHMPIGTFINKGAPPKESTNRQQTTRQAPSTAQQDPVQRDSQALLDQMSPEEIQDQVQELKAALSPDLVAFLQKRGRQKAKAANPKASEPVATATTVSTEQVPEETHNLRFTSIPLDDMEEKKRVASLLSSVKTPEDLDAVYAQEMGVADDDEGDDNPVEDDFQTACNLLRSTSTRQALWASRVVCQRLEEDVAAGKSFAINKDDKNAWPYPPVLAVSLRCLLDNPRSQSNGYLLHAYVLRSLYALLRLRAHSNHVLDVTCTVRTDASIFQEYFMDDAVPSPPFRSCYPTIPVQPVASTKEGDAVAYSTLSSSTSAQQDGQAFGKDPMWTLLTRMRILPRLADLLSVNLSDEAIVAICGILSMLSVRSTGTASAIAQHVTILQSLLKFTLLPPGDDDSDTQLHPGFFNTRVALPAVVFLCTLARQSRIAADAIPVDSILPPIVAMKAETDNEYTLQKWSLILWRTVLRYGLGLPSLNTFIALSIPHLASGQSTEHSLAAEFLSAFTNVCYCVRVAKSKPFNEWKSVMSSEASDALSSALTLLASSARQATHHVRDVESFSKASDICLMAARLHFLQSYFAAIKQEANLQGSEDIQLDREHHFDLDELVFALQNLSKRKDTQQVLQMIASCDSDPCALDANEGWVDLVSTLQEASACAFVDSLASILHTISIHHARKQVNDQSQDTVSSLLSKFGATFANWVNIPTAPSIGTYSQPKISSARRKWLNATAFHVVRFNVTDLNETESSTDDTALESIRSFAFSLVGCLQLGEESFAAILFSEDMLFRISNQSSPEPSPVSSLLMQELCATPLARQQLDHSFKLHYGFGITATEWGPFRIATLLSETDSQDPRSPTPFSELLLPMGPLWLYKILSGTANQEEASRTELVNETEIIASCLKLLVDLENASTSLSSSHAKHIPTGAKLYYLMNVFLHAESVLRDDRIGPLLEVLFDHYTSKQDEGVPLVESFWRACFDHSQISQKNYSGESDDMDTKDRQLFSMLMGRQDATEKELRPLIDFVADVCKVYLEYGAQYDSFTKCIRLFLSIAFPSQVRCEATRLLREVLHLLTLAQEEDEPFGLEISNALNLCLFGDATDKGEAVRDSSEFLDLIVSVMKVDRAGQADSSKWSAERGGFFFLFTVASLARNIATCIQDRTGMSIAKQRLTHLSKETKDNVLESADQLIDGANLVSTVMDVIKAHQGSKV